MEPLGAGGGAAHLRAKPPAAFSISVCVLRVARRGRWLDGHPSAGWHWAADHGHMAQSSQMLLVTKAELAADRVQQMPMAPGSSELDTAQLHLHAVAGR